MVAGNSLQVPLGKGGRFGQAEITDWVRSGLS